MRYTGFHRTIGILHKEHQRTWPIHFCNEIDYRAISQLRQHYAERNLDKPSPVAIVVKAIAIAIREVSQAYPEIHSYLRNVLGCKRIYTFNRISAGVAISRQENGQDLAITAVVQDPEQKLLRDITLELRGFKTDSFKDVPYMRNCYYLFRLPSPIQKLILLIGRSFSKTRRLYRGTFTLTSVGTYGVDIQLTLPQASSLQFGFGAICERPVVQEERMKGKDGRS